MSLSSLPIHYRSKEALQIFSALKTGESCQVIGMGSVGKSNLLRLLLQEDVRQKYLGGESGQFLLVLIDANKLLKRKDWGLYELMLHQLLDEMNRQGMPSEAIQCIDELHQRASRRDTRCLAARYLERALVLVCEKLEKRVVFLFDEFDIIGRKMSAKCFALLRAYRDEHKYRLMYVLAGRTHINQLRDRPIEIESFTELVTTHVLWLTTYAREDAFLMLRRLAKRQGAEVDEAWMLELMRITGGHPGLLRFSFRPAFLNPTHAFHELLEVPAVLEECQQIWLSIPPEEQKVLTGMAATSAALPPSSGSFQALREKGLIGGQWTAPDRIFSPLFEQYIQRTHPVVGAHISLDADKRIFYVDGKCIANLPPLEFRCLEYLLKKRGKVCDRDELVQYIYKDKIKESVLPDGQPIDWEGYDSSNNMIDSVIKRLRRSIDPGFGRPSYIRNERGIGYRLVDGEPLQE